MLHQRVFIFTLAIDNVNGGLELFILISLLIDFRKQFSDAC